MPRNVASFTVLAVALAFGAATVRAQETNRAPSDSTNKSDSTSKSDSTKPGVAPKPAPAPAPAPAPQAAPKPATPNLNFSVWAFGDFQYETDATAKKATGGSSPDKFDVGRAYLTFAGPLGDRVSYRVTADIKNGNTSFYNGWFFRLKYGFLQYNWLTSTPSGTSVGAATPTTTYVGPTGFARIGMVHTVLIDHEENFFPRYLTTTATEHWGFFASADVGAVVQMSLPNHIGEIYTDVVNGTNYDNQENNRYKDFQARFTLTPLAQGKSMFSTLAISPWISSGGNASKFLNDATNPQTAKLDKLYGGIFIGNRDRRFTFGVDYAKKKDGTDGTASAATDTIANISGTLTAGFVLIRPLEFSQPGRQKNSIGLILRVDNWKPNDDVDATQQFIVAGVIWEPTRNSALALDYQSNTPKANGTTGAKTTNWFLHWNLVFP